MSTWSTSDGFTGCRPPFGSTNAAAGCWHLATTECICPCHITEAVTVARPAELDDKDRT